MAPQVASLSELSRIRGDAEVRYPYAITQPELSASGLAQAKRQRRVRRGGGFGEVVGRVVEREEGGETDMRQATAR